MSNLKAKAKSELMPTEIGQIPKDWEVVQLGKVALSTESIDPAKHPSKEFAYVDISAIDSSSHRITNWNLIQGANAPSRARKLISAGDILFATTRPYLRNIAFVPSALDQQVCSTGFCVIRPNPKLATSPWIFYNVLTNRFVSKVTSRMKGATYPAVSDADVLVEKIPIPPLPEQKKIVAILSTVDEAIGKVDEAIGKTERVKKGLMQELLTKGIGHTRFKRSVLGQIPTEWSVQALSSVCEKPEYGYTEKASCEPIGPKFLRITDIQDGRVDWDSVPYCQLPEKLFDKYQLQDGDILFARTGATTGKSFLIKHCPKAVFASYLIRVRTKAALTPEFLFYMFNSDIYWRQIRQKSVGSAQGGINASLLSELIILVAPEREQRKIVEVLSTVDNRLELLRQRREKLNRIKKALMNDLLTGKKRVKV